MALLSRIVYGMINIIRWQKIFLGLEKLANGLFV